ncbi:hypothetical protein PUNSTDRAFT_128467 [Punctularia strigosozonata HHB-11173 SS5]|uniref:Uncharacterized protein n=1 Tax=Punctularia strigosozonata (strain HHB-11173) TaxID=741275 RepID=R7S4I9_PUNST|nr:uncharacterized protein PUNSTDRAFT_128467 [Punctularia strigosozonata HHB-11173 SS5]EIN04161.1 hypothetical protein PUNSTDRAFT_128467 [Punctularia strigosozonata HHB-11173 SS5]
MPFLGRSRSLVALGDSLNGDQRPPHGESTKASTSTSPGLLTRTRSRLGLSPNHARSDSGGVTMPESSPDLQPPKTPRARTSALYPPFLRKSLSRPSLRDGASNHPPKDSPPSTSTDSSPLIPPPPFPKKTSEVRLNDERIGFPSTESLGSVLARGLKSTNEAHARAHAHAHAAASPDPPTLLSSPTPSRSSKLLNRVSRIFGGREHGRHLSTGAALGLAVEHVAPARSSASATSRSPSPEDDEEMEIRPPSGLGRRGSLFSNVSLPSPTTPTTPVSPFSSSTLGRPGGLKIKISAAGTGPNLVTRGHRERSISSPDLSSALAPPSWSSLSLSFPSSTSSPRPITPPAPPARFPPSVLALICFFSSPASLCALALTSKSVCRLAQDALYSSIDLSLLHPALAERCLATLSTRPHLSALVRTFVLPTTPSSTSAPSTPSTPSPTSTALALCLALRTMSSLISLSAPFSPALAYAPPTPTLTHVRILSSSLSPAEHDRLLAWLAERPSITRLALPSLSDPPPTPTADDATPPDASTLPRLASYTGPPALAAHLAPGRPLVNATLVVHTTLYDGLRPAALMRALSLASPRHPPSSSASSSLLPPASSPPAPSTPATPSEPGTLRELGIHAAPRVDARTLEKVLMAAGSQLGDRLRELEVGAGILDENLYKMITPVLPRFTSLKTLRVLPLLPNLYASSSSSSSSSVEVSPETARAWARLCPTLERIEIGRARAGGKAWRVASRRKRGVKVDRREEDGEEEGEEEAGVSFERVILVSVPPSPVAWDRPR